MTAPVRFYFDSLPFLEGFLRGEDPVPEGLLARWADLPANATRS